MKRERKQMKREKAEDEDERTDRQASHKASDLPVPECRFILNAVSTAGPSLKGQTNRQRLVFNRRSRGEYASLQSAGMGHND